LNLCTDKHGNLWTGDQSIMEQLMVLGIATGLMEYCIRDREVLPGGMPCVKLC